MPDSKRHDIAAGARTSRWLHLGDDGDRAVVAFLGEPFPYEASFVGGRTVPVAGGVARRRSSIRIAWTVAVFAGDEGPAWAPPLHRGAAPRRRPRFELAIFEHGSIVYRTLVSLFARFSHADWVFEIVRHGARSVRHTTYSVTALRRLSAVERRALARVRPFDLALHCGEAVRPVGAPAAGDAAPPTLRSADVAATVEALEVRVPRRGTRS